MVSTTDTNSAVYSSIGPTFGEGHDFYIVDQSNISSGSHSLLYSYTQPTTFPSGSNERTFLTGGFTSWLTTEIEVFQLSNSG